MEGQAPDSVRGRALVLESLHSPHSTLCPFLGALHPYSWGWDASSCMRPLHVLWPDYAFCVLRKKAGEAALH